MVYKANAALVFGSRADKEGVAIKSEEKDLMKGKASETATVRELAGLPMWVYVSGARKELVCWLKTALV